MSIQTLISAATLRQRLGRGDPLVLLDCGHDLMDPDAGARAYASGHLPGAHRADVEHDLAGPRTGRNGRHPLPDRQRLAATVARWGIRPGVAVVCYDDQGMAYAARAWWLLHWLGHAQTTVLDGGRAAWLAAGGALETQSPARVDAPPYPAGPAGMPIVDAAALLDPDPRWQVLDARAGERFRGEIEPLDPVAGHIPGARNRFFRDNLGPDGCFKAADQLRAEFEALTPQATLGLQPVVHQCGSGVTACHSVLAMAHAGLGVTRLYPGSWSEWCADPQRPVAVGP